MVFRIKVRSVSNETYVRYFVGFDLVLLLDGDASSSNIIPAAPSPKFEHNKVPHPGHTNVPTAPPIEQDTNPTHREKKSRVDFFNKDDKTMATLSMARLLLLLLLLLLLSSSLVGGRTLPVPKPGMIT